LEENVQVEYKNQFVFPEWLFPSITTVPFFLLGWNVYQRISSSLFTDFQKYEYHHSTTDSSLNYTFQDWGGSKEVVRECKETIQYFLHPNPLVKRPKGILLEGPPGTGKTMLGKIMANHVNASFIVFSGSSFVELYAGMGALRVRRLFEYARKHSPCIIFLDEIDAIGQRRKQTSIGNEEREQALNQLLYEMDGFEPNHGILVMAATNRKDILDEALLRPGRFDKIIPIPLPDPASRRDIIKILVRNKKIEKNTIDWDLLISHTEGYSGADLEQWINEAVLLSLRNSENILTQECLWDALERTQVGIKKEVDMRLENTKKRVAIHEAGHTLLCLCFPEYFMFQKVSIQQSYSGMGGYTMYNLQPEYNDNTMMTKDLLVKQIQMLLGGRIAESVFYGNDHVSLGAHDDLMKANELCRQMVSQFGMGSKLNNIVSSDENIISDNLLTMMDYDGMTILRSAMYDTRRLVQKHVDFIERVAEELVFDVSLSKKEVETLWSVYNK
jgi:cell division protease FtsH